MYRYLLGKDIKNLPKKIDNKIINLKAYDNKIMEHDTKIVIKYTINDNSIDLVYADFLI